MKTIYSQATHYNFKHINNVQLCILANNQYLVGMLFVNNKEEFEYYNKNNLISLKCKDNDIIVQTCNELNLYFQGKLRNFTVPCYLVGTKFQLHIWNSLQDIAYGESISYKIFSIKCFEIKYLRAVSSNIGRNPIAIIYPCHRVIGTNNSLIGYAGGLDLKKKLLNLEKQNIK